MEKMYRCEICGKVSNEPGLCCGVEMKDLTSKGCMGCRGCGMHKEE
jgi:hypothetical protein